MTVEEALAAATAEGISLEPSVTGHHSNPGPRLIPCSLHGYRWLIPCCAAPCQANAAGYRGVKVSTRSKTRPFQANVKRGGKNVYLGNFATAEEAALCYARTPDAQAPLSTCTCTCTTCTCTCACACVMCMCMWHVACACAHCICTLHGTVPCTVPCSPTRRPDIRSSDISYAAVCMYSSVHTQQCAYAAVTVVRRYICSVHAAGSLAHTCSSLSRMCTLHMCTDAQALCVLGVRA